MARKTRIILGIVALCFLVFGVLLWRLVSEKQDILTKQAVRLLNTKFVGTLQIREAKIVLWKQFPYLSLDVRGVRFYATRDTSEQPLYAFDDAYIGFNILDILQEQYRVKHLTIEGGHIDIVKYADGKVNILEAKGIKTSADEDSTETMMTFDMQQLTLKNLRAAYHDRAAKRDIVATIERLETAFTLAPERIGANLSAALVLDVDTNGQHTFFHDKHITLETTIDIDKQQEKFTLGNTRLGLEKAIFQCAGWLNAKDSMNCSLEFHGEKPSLLTFAAFAPASIQAALERYSNEGKVTFDGFLRGKLQGELLPEFRVDFACEDAKVVNTTVNKKVRDIFFSGFITNGAERSMKTSEFRLRNIRATPDVGIFRGDIAIRNFDDPFINMDVNADLDLEFLAQFLGIEGLKRLKGQIVLDMNFNELVDIDKPDSTLLRLKEGIDSELSIKNLSVEVPNYPHPITNINGHAIMKKGFLTLDDLSCTIAGSDVHFDGTFSDVPALFHAQRKPVEITLNALSKRLNLQELVAFDSTLAQTISEEISGLAIRISFQTSADELRNFHFLPKGEFIIHHVSGKFKNYPHEIHDIHADIAVDENALTVKDISGMIDKSDVRLQATVENYRTWLDKTRRGETSVRYNISSTYFSLKDILSYEGRNYVPEQYRSEEIKNFALVGTAAMRFDTTLRFLEATIGKLSGDFALHKMKLKNGAARFHAENSLLTLDTFRVNIGASDIAAKGAFPLSTALIKDVPTRLEIASERLNVDELLMIKQNAVRLAKQTSVKQTSTMQTASKQSSINQTSIPQSAANSDSANHATAFNIFAVPFPQARISALVRQLQFRSMRIQDFKLALRTEPNHSCYVDTLDCRIAEGRLGLQGRLEAATPQNITLSMSAAIEKIRLEALLVKFDNFGQDKLISENISGVATGLLKGTFALHPDLTPILSKSEAQIDAMLKEGELLNFAPLQAMKRFFRDKNMNRVRFDTVKNTLSLKNGTLSFPAMTINSSLGYIELAGEQNIQRSSGFQMDYVIGIPFGVAAQAGFSTLFGGNAKDSIPQDRIDAIQYRPQGSAELLIKMRVQGTPGAFSIRPGGK